MNSFRTFTQALDGVMNLHKLNKRDCITKNFQSLFTVLEKESNKLYVSFNQQVRNHCSFGQALEKKLGKGRESYYGMTKELANTAQSHNLPPTQKSLPVVKKEEIHMNMRMTR